MNDEKGRVLNPKIIAVGEERGGIFSQTVTKEGLNPLYVIFCTDFKEPDDPSSHPSQEKFAEGFYNMLRQINFIEGEASGELRTIIGGYYWDTNKNEIKHPFGVGPKKDGKATYLFNAGWQPTDPQKKSIDEKGSGSGWTLFVDHEYSIYPHSGNGFQILETPVIKNLVKEKLAATRSILQATYTPRKPKDSPSTAPRALEKGSFVAHLTPSREELDELANRYKKELKRQGAGDLAEREKALRNIDIISAALSQTGRINVLRSAKQFADLEVDMLARIAEDLIELRQATLDTTLNAHKTILEQFTRAEALSGTGAKATPPVPGVSVKALMKWALRNNIEMEGALKSLALGEGLSLKLQKIEPAHFRILASRQIDRLRDQVKEFKRSMNVEPVGYLHLERMSFTPAGIERGELVYSVPLSPGEEVNITHREWAKTSEEFERIVTDYMEEFSEEGVTEKSELSEAVDSQSKHQTAFNTKVTATGSYGGSVKISATVGYDASESASKSTKLSRIHSADITHKASSRAKKEHKMSFKVASAAETEDQTVRKIKNPFTDKATRIDYYQLIRKWQVDLFRYGIRLTWDIAIPEPGSGLLSKLMEIQDIREKLNLPFEFDLKPQEITLENYLEKAERYGVPINIEAPQSPRPISETFVGKWGLEQQVCTDGPPHFLETVEVPIPDGYKIKDAKIVIFGKRCPEYVSGWGIDIFDMMAAEMIFRIGHNDYEYIGFDEEIDRTDKWNGKSGTIVVVIWTWRIRAVTLKIEGEVEISDALLQSWRQRVWQAIHDGAYAKYYEKRKMLQDRLSLLQEELGAQDALSLRKKEREEVMKGVLRWLGIHKFKFFPKELREQYLFSIDNAELFEDDLNNGIISKELKDKFKTEGFSISENAMVTKGKANKWMITDGEEIYIVKKEDGELKIYLEQEDLYEEESELVKEEIDFELVRTHGEMIKFLHHAIEWENMLYFLYPYFWCDPSSWEFKKYLDHPDPMHRAFLKAGSARVVLTLRPGFEDAFMAFINTGEIKEFPPFPYLEIGEEFKNYAKTNYPGIPAANPVENYRLLLYPKQRQAWEEMQLIMGLLEEYRKRPFPKQRQAWKDILRIMRFLEEYHKHKEEYPLTLAELAEYFPDEMVPTVDPWSTDYVYKSPGDHGNYDLASYGKNGELGGEGEDADITSWAEPEGGEYPATLQLLKDNFDGEETVPMKDPWGTDYVYKSPGDYGEYDLVSYGKNGELGGEDEDADITSWAEASMIGQWYEYTPTSALDIKFDEKMPEA